MDWEVIVSVRADPMVDLARFAHRVDMDYCRLQVAQVVEQLVADLLGDAVCLDDGEVGVNGDIQLRVEPMAHPPGPDVGDFANLVHM